MLFFSLQARKKFKLSHIGKKNPEEKVLEDKKEEKSNLEGHIIVCGYGELGRKILEYFKGCNTQYIAVDKNYTRVEQGAKDGEHIVYGNATHRSILEQLGIKRCAAVIIAIDSIESVGHIYQEITSLAPLCKVILKTKKSDFAAQMKANGVYGVVHERREIAKILSDLALQAANEQLTINEE